MPRQKLFSTEAKRDLAGHTANYKFNQQRANNGVVYALQAAEAAWCMSDIFIAAAEAAVDEKDLVDVIQRVAADLDEVVLLWEQSFDERKIELISWLKKRRTKASATAKRLRKL